ncbi:MAG: hypothetical protein R6V10_02055 [bacterium]
MPLILLSDSSFHPWLRTVFASDKKMVMGLCLPSMYRVRQELCSEEIEDVRRSRRGACVSYSKLSRKAGEKVRPGGPYREGL